MKMPEPVGYYNPESGMLTSNTAMKGVLNIEWLNLYTEAQLREALASNEAVMRMALEALLTVANPKAPAAIKALEEQLK